MNLVSTSHSFLLGPSSPQTVEVFDERINRKLGVDDQKEGENLQQNVQILTFRHLIILAAILSVVAAVSLLLL